MIRGYIKKGSNQTDWIIWLQQLLSQVDYTGAKPISIDGIFGPVTEEKVKEFQSHEGLIVDGIAGIKTFKALMSYCPGKTNKLKRDKEKFLSESDITYISDMLGVSPAIIKAVKDVESRGEGFIDGNPKILFEGHIFWKLLTKAGYKPQKLRKGNEDILYMTWTTRHYKGGLLEYDRLNKAKKINKDLALQSCSWGLFQIMGYHYKKLRYKTIDEFVKSMYASEKLQFEAFARYVITYRLKGYLKTRDWEGFARAYNGPGYKKNNYHKKLKRAYERYSS